MHLRACCSQSFSPRPLSPHITVLQQHNFIKVSLCVGASLTGALSCPSACHRWLQEQAFHSLSSHPQMLTSSLLPPSFTGQTERLLNNMRAPQDLLISLLLSRWARRIPYSLIAVSSGFSAATETQERTVTSAWSRPLHTERAYVLSESPFLSLETFLTYCIYLMLLFTATFTECISTCSFFCFPALSQSVDGLERILW